MASTIRIKRSGTSVNLPAGGLRSGELAYIWASDLNKLYIGSGNETNGSADNIHVIGGKFFTDMLDHTPGTLTASSAIIVDSNSKIDNLKVDNLDLNGNTISTTNTNGNLILQPDGSGEVQLSSHLLKIGESNNAATITTFGAGNLTLNTNNGTTSGFITIAEGSNGNITITPDGTGSVVISKIDVAGGEIDGVTIGTNSAVTDLRVDNLKLDGNTLSATNANGNVVLAPAGTGTVDVSGAKITGVATPTQNTDAANKQYVDGQLGTAVNLTIAGDTGGTDSVNLATDTLTFTGTDPIDTTISNNTVTISAKDATTSAKGVASFDSGDFSVTNGAVSIKAAGVANNQLENSSVQFGSTTVSLGGSSTVIAGLEQLDVDNVRIDGNTISSTNSNGNLIFDPNGTGTVDVSNARITGLADPQDPTDAATKGYVDARAAGLDPKESVRVATTGNITLSNTQSVDGVALSIGNRVLVRAQTNATENGIYVVASGAWTRATDFDAPAEITAGVFTFVEEGTAYADSGWVVSSASVGTIGTDTIEFVQFSGAGQIVAGSGLTKTGNQLDIGAGDGIQVNADTVALASTVAGAGLTYTTGVLAVGGTADRITVSTDAIDIASTYVGQNTITTLGTIATGTWQATVISPTYGGTGVNNGSKTITLNGNFTTAGSAEHSTTLTTTANTAVTLPTTGTLATLAGQETLTNKTLGGGTGTTTTIASNLIPGTNEAYDLGSSTNRFKDLYLKGTSIFLGGITLQEQTTGGAKGLKVVDTLSGNASSIDATPIGANSRSTGAFTTLTANDAVTFTANTASTNTTTGAVIVTGGLGVGGAIYAGSIQNTPIGSTTANTAAFTTLTANNAVTFTAGTSSTTTTTGTVVITGGLGVSGRINAANVDAIIGANNALAGTFTSVKVTGNLTGAGSDPDAFTSSIDRFIIDGGTF